MIIVTRPSPYGELLVNHLLENNILAQHFPIFTIHPGKEIPILKEKLAKLRPDDIIIIASPQVIYMLEDIQFSKEFFSDDLQYMSVGAQTAQQFQRYTGLNVTYPDNGDNSEALLAITNQKIPNLVDVKNKRILILRGNNGRQLLGDTLVARGADVDFCECYHRKTIIYTPADTELWHNSTAIVVTSLESLLCLDKYITTKHKQNCMLIVTSERVLQVAKKSHWRNSLLANSANNQILFKTIMTLCNNDAKYAK